MRKIDYQKLDLKRGVDFIGVCVVFYCHDGKANLLMHKRSKNCRDEIGTWDVGGGSVEFGENFEDATRREIREEYGVDPSNLEFIGVKNVLRQNGKSNTHWVALVYLAQVEPKQVKISDPDKMDELGWFSLENLPEPLHSAFGVFLEDIKSKL